MKSPAASAVIGVILAATILSQPAHADPFADNNPKIKVQPFVPLKVQAFPLPDVRLLDGPFRRAMELDEAYLLSLDPDRLLYNFRVNAGLPTRGAQPLGGWEEPTGELRGHFVGHYLSACAMMYASTGDARLKARGDAVVAGMAECQAKLGSGYLSAYPETFIDRVERRSQVWAPYYTLHKIFAGLLDMYEYGDNAQALEVAKKFGDWVIARNGRLTDEQMQAMMQTEHGGMNETLANLYAFTGEDKYLKIAFRFNHYRVLNPASAREDRLTGLHANTQFPKFIGAAREYELTGDYSLKAAATFFWNAVVQNRSYVIGGNSDGEAFTDTNRLSQMGINTTETCNTYNMLKLTRHLFCWDPKAEYADYYERALFNHILASQNPADGMMCYYVPLRSGSRKTYNTPLDSFWCCTGTGVENHAQYGDSLYFHDDQNLYVNQFIASELNWKARGLKLRQETQYPDTAATKLVFTCDHPVELSLQLRHPAWAVGGIQISINGEKQSLDSAPGSWVALKRTWKSGDTVEVALSFSLHTEAFKDNPNRFAVLNGPIVLCAEVDAQKPFPVTLSSEQQLLTRLSAVAGKPNTFVSAPDGLRIPGDDASPAVTLVPFYKMHNDRRYEVYWDRFTPEQWQAEGDRYRTELARQRDLEARTVDWVTPGGEQNERDHNLQGENMAGTEFNEVRWRVATNGGWFSWDVKVLPNQAQELRVSYVPDSGRRGRGAGASAFDILVNGEKLATVDLSGRGGGRGGRGAAVQRFEETYPLPPNVIAGKAKVTVKFRAGATNVTGRVFELRVLRSAPAGQR